MTNKILRDLHLLFESPKDFLFSFNYSDKEKIILKKYDPRAKVAADSLIRQLKKIGSGVNFYLIGSTPLRIYGTGDIDLFGATRLDLRDVALKYRQLIGKPVKTRRNFLKWEINYHGFVVEFFLSHPENKQFKSQVKLFNLLKHNPQYLKEYVALKKKINGESVREYVRQRMIFFNRLLKENRDIV